MSFLFPLYLLGAAALAVPILLHLRRRPPKEHIPFSSHMFLEQTPERLTRRTKLERLILLAFRCLALLLLAFAFGRPFISALSPLTTVDAIGRTVVLVDRSASMHREDLWERAIEAAVDEISQAAPEDEVAIALFDDEFELVADLSEWASLSPRARVAAFEDYTKKSAGTPSWKSTDLGRAMLNAADLLLGADMSRPANQKQVVVISDFQTGSDQRLLQSEAWSDSVNVRCLPIEPKAHGNLSLSLAATPPRANIAEAEIYRVRIHNASDSDSARATLTWEGFPETAIDTTIAPGTSRIIRSMARPTTAENGTLLISGDDHPFDNSVYVSPVQARPLRILVTGDTELNETAGSPLFYLTRALQPTPTLTPIVRTSLSLSDENLNDTEVIFVIDRWSPEMGAQLNQFAAQGGLVIALPSAKAPADSFATLVENENWTLSESTSDDYALLADLDFDHPVLEPFARARIRDFTNVRFWKHRHLQLPEAPDDSTKVIATFDGESPALVETRVGEGAVFAFLSGWTPRESQLALSSKFVPLLFSILEHTGFSISSQPTFYVGETGAENPGFIEIEKDGTKSLLAINLDPQEGITAPFDPNIVFKELGIPLLNSRSEIPDDALTEEQLKRLESEDKEKNQKLWKWIILSALIILMIESWLAGRIPGGQAQTPTPAHS